MCAIRTRRVTRLRPLAILLATCCLLVARAGAQDASAPSHLVMISIDGLRPDYVIAADRLGAKIPNLRRFLEEGAHADGVQGVVPTVTYSSHTTLVTGVWPAKHGIVANMPFDPLQKNQNGWYWYADDVRAPTLWDAAARAGRTTASLQWPVTVGARVTWNIPEFWRAGTADDGKLLRAVSTPGVLAEAEAELGPYPRALDIDADEVRGRFAVWLLEKKRPALFTVHLIALDYAQHETGPFSAETLAVLERLDTVVAKVREAAERLAPGRADVAVVSDHGFARADMQLNLVPTFRAAGLVSVDRGKVTDWKAMPWTNGGSAAIVLNDPGDATTLHQVRALLDKLAADPANGIDRVLDAQTLHDRGGFPTASFLVGLEPGWQTRSSPTGPLLSRRPPGGDHGHLPDVPDLSASFFLVGPGVPAGRSLGTIDMRDVAPTLARRLGLPLPSADGKALLP